jgi:hypothetical protein
VVNTVFQGPGAEILHIFLTDPKGHKQHSRSDTKVNRKKSSKFTLTVFSHDTSEDPKIWGKPSVFMLRLAEDGQLCRIVTGQKGVI